MKFHSNKRRHEITIDDDFVGVTRYNWHTSLDGRGVPKRRASHGATITLIQEIMGKPPEGFRWQRIDTSDFNFTRANIEAVRIRGGSFTGKKNISRRKDGTFRVSFVVQGERYERKGIKSLADALKIRRHLWAQAEASHPGFVGIEKKGGGYDANN